MIVIRIRRKFSVTSIASSGSRIYRNNIIYVDEHRASRTGELCYFVHLACTIYIRDGDLLTVHAKPGAAAARVQFCVSFTVQSGRPKNCVLAVHLSLNRRFSLCFAASTFAKRETR